MFPNIWQIKLRLRYPNSRVINGNMDRICPIDPIYWITQGCRQIFENMRPGESEMFLLRFGIDLIPRILDLLWLILQLFIFSKAVTIISGLQSSISLRYKLMSTLAWYSLFVVGLLSSKG
ncbi:hypothetical protein METBIDRAFT_176130 [Metschnikowia bicuspidata var. bicuspidata NRRL YB-4993]|uniref:Uncharacterized protein n=1 Tax=Metschnikowia bicuspidata var. bicuspidata NRRL YB-4993 TaxID=869754 RepID=A0A1A0HAI2_9ASCO|nr:hypothetical protein METBIDRAFT_176130 [Metschnikowia bicuspidata var. bicuspidata NRRL YB-4993]OBA21139.1 hypothetical protein METBIDRAFT_176130 [Metschnikowia bicuspidata var. bicuspidata NRRL YB-4993]